MNRRIATILTAGLLAAGCAGSTETVETMQAQLESHVNSLDALQLDLQGAATTADAKATTFLAQPQATVSSTNSLTSSMVAQVHRVLTQGTAVSNAQGSLLVTLDDPREFTWKVAAEVQPDSATFTLQIKPQASDDAGYVTVASGQATRTSSSRQGSFSLDLDALKTVDKSALGQGQLFSAFTADSASKRICTRLTGSFGVLHAPIDSSLAASVQMDSLETRVHFEYASSGLLGASTASYELRIVPGAGGRGELIVANGTLGSVDSVACWNCQNQTLYFDSKTCLLGACSDTSVGGNASRCDSAFKMEEPLSVGQPGCDGLPSDPTNPKNNSTNFRAE